MAKKVTATKRSASKVAKLSPEEFVRRAVLRLRNGKSKGIHSVFSGFNAAVQEYYNVDPVEFTQELERKGVIVMRPAKKGMMIYLAEDAPALKANALMKILEDYMENLEN